MKINKALKALDAYCEEKNILQIDLFSKEELMENVNEKVWDWSIQDELNEGCSYEEAKENTAAWLFSKSKENLVENYILTDTYKEMLMDKAYELGLVE